MKKLNAHILGAGIAANWRNQVVGEVNDHVVRLALLQRDFHWHVHADSDEFFYVIEGELHVDFDHGSETLRAGEMLTVPRQVRHRTRSSQRTLILCVESANNDIAGD